MHFGHDQVVFVLNQQLYVLYILHEALDFVFFQQIKNFLVNTKLFGLSLFMISAWGKSSRNFEYYQEIRTNIHGATAFHK